ncbi:hypothetical protein [Paenibacillus motobuensis]|uniref:Uncharacterized protein n=1 Tax=Paenibacillus motobuensis TaxID=295324 RepID=A0ABN0YPH9_9BACL
MNAKLVPYLMSEDARTQAEKSVIRSSFSHGEPVMVKFWTGSVLRGSLLQQSDHGIGRTLFYA